MTRASVVAILVVLALPAAAQANPSIVVTSARVGSTAKLPATVRHTLQLTAGATAEQVSVSVSPAAQIVLTGVPTPPPVPQTGPSVTTCEGRWTRFHNAYRGGPIPDDVFFTIPAGQTATLTADVRLVRAPWADETLDATWSIEPAQGRAFDVVSNAPLYSGPLGVRLNFDVIRAADGRYVVSGTAAPDVDSGQVELWAYAPGAKKPRRVARVPVHTGTWAYTRFAPARRGKWELYARYRTARKAYADDASECGTIIRVHGLVLPVRCSAACDVRASVPGGAEGLAALKAAGTARLKVDAEFDPIEVPRSGRVPMRVLSGPPGARIPRTRTLAVRLRKPPLPRLLALTARQRGRSVVIRWRTALPVHDTDFIVQALRAGSDIADDTVVGEDGKSFRLQLDDAPRADTVEIDVVTHRDSAQRRLAVTRLR